MCKNIIGKRQFWPERIHPSDKMSSKTSVQKLESDKNHTSTVGRIRKTEGRTRESRGKAWGKQG
eukprot:12420139-Karenia_brevis.AAC.1